MKTKHLFPMIAAAFSTYAAAAPLKFSAPPTLERFPDGAVEWRAALNCADPPAFSDARILFSFDFNLDGEADGARDSTLLSSADCDQGAVHVLRTFFPSGSGILTAELWQGNSASDRSFLFAGGIGSVLSMRRFCARPSNGEPEWVEMRNNSAVRVNLEKIKFEGHALSGGLEAGASVIVGKDSTAIRDWQPEADIITTSSWSSLRNTGDTIRLTWDIGVILDSILYGSATDPREGCASTVTEENVAAASGYELKVPVQRWNRTAPLDIEVQAPVSGKYDLHVYDLDGFDLCKVAGNRTGPAKIQLVAADCRGLAYHAGSVLLQLRPQGSAPIRKMIRVTGY